MTCDDDWKEDEQQQNLKDCVQTPRNDKEYHAGKIIEKEKRKQYILCTSTSFMS